jgi:hypothetical protein
LRNTTCFRNYFFPVDRTKSTRPLSEKECFTFCDIVQNLMRNFLIISWYPVTLDLLQFTESLLALKLGVVVNRILMSIIHLFWPNEQIWAIKREQVVHVKISQQNIEHPSKLWSNFFEKNIFFCFILFKLFCKKISERQLLPWLS